MLAIQDVSLQVEGETGSRALLAGITVNFPRSHFAAIIGPSGCGKTSLLKLIAGIAPGREEGSIHWRGRNLAEEDFRPGEIAYVPQFSIAHEELSARECVSFALALRVRTGDRETTTKTREGLLEETGLADFADLPVSVLSGGQRRRLALAIELTSQPEILLCDEVTSGLDYRAAHEIVSLLREQARKAERLVLSVTHSLEHLGFYDSVFVLHHGMVAYHGPATQVVEYFELENVLDLYARLDERTPEEWQNQWQAGQTSSSFSELRATGRTELHVTARVPGGLTQWRVLLHRRILIFFRSRSQVWLQLGFIVAFPLLVALFAWNGLPAVENLSLGFGGGGFQRATEARDFLTHSSKLGSLVSGLVMFQVILLTLMGANNSGREIAGERPIFEQEKLSGLSTFAYVASKASFLLALVALQSLWMGFFVHRSTDFPGDLLVQIGYLLLVNGAITSLCLGISSLLRSPEQASLVSIYLVGFQLPLSGAVLALPEPFGPLLRPFISAYWSWSGILQTLREERCYEIVKSVIQSPLSPAPTCVLLLVAHVVAGLLVAWAGCSRRQLV